ncbi:MAG: hypothetical protein HOQ24_07210 [Mycobacteriaceae bacterium]|nr:hypothetical protein [Mycobacteriaceae bacterium]
MALAPGGGGIPLGDIDQDELLRSVTNVLRTRLRALIQTAAFNNIGRSAQQLTFHTNELVNRHTNNSVRINTTTIDHGATANFANNVTTTGFIVFRNFAGTETYYRNYDIRETADAAADERLKVLENPVKLEGSVTQNYNIALL